jgi:hypothetical protein
MPRHAIGIWQWWTMAMQVHHRPSLLSVSCKPERRKLHLLVHPQGHDMYPNIVSSFFIFLKYNNCRGVYIFILVLLKVKVA